MRIYLGGYLDFYHPQRKHWLDVEISEPKPLLELLSQLGIPAGEVHLVVINEQVQELETAIVNAADEIKLYSAVGGG